MIRNKILEIINVEKSFKSKKVLDIIDFSLYDGEKVIISGGNGSGKSTLLKIIKGSLSFESGVINVEKNDALMVQSGAKGFYGYLSAKDNIRYYLALNNIKIQNVTAEFNRLTEVFDFAEYLNVSFDKLSLGNKQKSILIANLLIDCKLLLVDEPTIGLDIASKQILAKELLKRTCAMIVVTHDIEFVRHLELDVYEMECGKITNVWTFDTFIDEKKAQVRYRFKVVGEVLKSGAVFDNGYYIVEDKELCEYIFREYEVLEFKVI